MNPHHPNVGTIDHIDHSRAKAFADALHSIGSADQDPRLIRDWERSVAQQAFKPSHWPPRLTRMALAVRLGTTRMLLERKS